MTWLPKHQPEDSAGFKKVSPGEVLYSFDGPSIFLSKIGPFDVLFYKYEELEDNDLFLAVALSKSTVAALKSGALSIRGALQTDDAWIVECNSDLVVQRTWSIAGSQFPPSLLPLHRTGIRPGLKNVADTLSAAFALFALSFQGKVLRREGMPLSAFKGLVDRAYDATRKILVPSHYSGFRSRLLDFEISPPKFSSLVLAINESLINAAEVERRLKSADAALNVSEQKIRNQIANNGTSFMEQVDELVGSAAKGEISSAVARERFTALEQVESILPTEHNRLSELAIATNFDGVRSGVVIAADAGDKMIRARKLAETLPIDDIGTVMLLNGKQNTFVIQSKRGKEVTCILDEETFNDLRNRQSLDIGTQVQVTGTLKRRRKRDLLTVTKRPQIVPRAI